MTPEQILTLTVAQALAFEEILEPIYTEEHRLYCIAPYGSEEERLSIIRKNKAGSFLRGVSLHAGIYDHQIRNGICRDWNGMAVVYDARAKVIGIK